MLTDLQLIETALRIVSAHLRELVDPACEMGDFIDAVIRELNPEDSRVDADWPAEHATVKREIADAVLHLRARLALYANTRGAALAADAA